MKRFRLLIVARDDNACIGIYDQYLPFSIMTKDGAMLDAIRAIMPTVDWKIDDGKDVAGSEFCTYVFYNKNEIDGYLLASWAIESF